MSLEGCKGGGNTETKLARILSRQVIQGDYVVTLFEKSCWEGSSKCNSWGVWAKAATSWRTVWMKKEKISNWCGWKNDEESRRRSMVKGEYSSSAVDGSQGSLPTWGEGELDKKNGKNGVWSRSGEMGGKLYGRKKSDFVNGQEGGRQHGWGDGSSAGVASVASTFCCIPLGVVRPSWK